MGWPLGLNASSSSLPLPQVGDGFTPAIPVNSKPATVAPTDQTDFKQQRPELLGQILEMQRFMSNLAIEQPDHWLNWGIAQLQKKKTSTQLLEKGALSLDELAEKLAVGKIGVLEARKQFRAILKENNLNFEQAVNQEAGVFENLAFGAQTIDKLSDQGVQEVLAYKFGPEIAFFGSGSYRVLKLILREYLTVKNESDCPSDDKAVLQKAFDRIMQNGTWKPAFQETAQDYLQRKFSRAMPKEVGQVLQSGALYFGTDLMSQIMSNLLYEKPPFENLDAKSLGLSFVVGLAGGVLGKQLDKTNLSDIHKLLIEAGYDGTSAVLQEIILQISNGVSLKEIFSEKSMKALFQQLLLEGTGNGWVMGTNSMKNNQENSITEQNNINTEEQTQTNKRQTTQAREPKVIFSGNIKEAEKIQIENGLNNNQEILRKYNVQQIIVSHENMSDTTTNWKMSGLSEEANRIRSNKNLSSEQKIEQLNKLGNLDSIGKKFAGNLKEGQSVLILACKDGETQGFIFTKTSKGIISQPLDLNTANKLAGGIKLGESDDLAGYITNQLGESLIKQIEKDIVRIGNGLTILNDGTFYTNGTIKKNGELLRTNKREGFDIPIYELHFTPLSPSGKRIQFEEDVLASEKNFIKLALTENILELIEQIKNQKNNLSLEGYLFVDTPNESFARILKNKFGFGLAPNNIQSWIKIRELFDLESQIKEYANVLIERKKQATQQTNPQNTQPPAESKGISSTNAESLARFSTRSFSLEFEEFSGNLVKEVLAKISNNNKFENVNDINDFLRTKRKEYALRNGTGYEVIKNARLKKIDYEKEEIVFEAVDNNGEQKEYTVKGNEYLRVFGAINKTQLSDLADTSQVFPEIKIPTTPNILLEYGLPRGNMIIENEIIPMNIEDDYMRTSVNGEFLAYQESAKKLLDKYTESGLIQWQEAGSFKMPNTNNQAEIHIRTRQYTHYEVIDGNKIELTTTRESEANGVSQLTWNHTLVSNSKILEPFIQTLFEKSTNLNLSFDERTKALAQMAYLSFHQCADARGSASRTDWLTEIAAQKGNIQLFSWKEGVLPDGEALSSVSMEAFVKDFIEGKFSKTKPQPLISPEIQTQDPQPPAQSGEISTDPDIQAVDNSIKLERPEEILKVHSENIRKYPLLTENLNIPSETQKVITEIESIIPNDVIIRRFPDDYRGFPTTTASYQHSMEGAEQSGTRIIAIKGNWQNIVKTVRSEVGQKVWNIIANKYNLPSLDKLSDEYLYTFLLLHEIGHSIDHSGKSKETYNSQKTQENSLLPSQANSYGHFIQINPQATENEVLEYLTAYRNQPSETFADNFAVEQTGKLKPTAQSEQISSINSTLQNLSKNPEAGYILLSGLKPKVPSLVQALLKKPLVGTNPNGEYFPNFPTFKNWLGLSSKQVSNNSNTPKTQTENPTEITQNNTQEETVSNAQTQEEPQINPNNSQNSSENTQNTTETAKPNISSDDFIRSLQEQNPQKAKYLEYILNKYPELKNNLENVEVQKNLEEVELREGTTNDDVNYNLKLIQSILPTALEIKLNETLEKEVVREVNNINQQDIKEIKDFLQLIKINNPETYDVLLFVVNNNLKVLNKLTEPEVQNKLQELESSSSSEDEVLLQNLNSIKEILGLKINNINTPKNSNWVELEDTWNFTDEPLAQALGLENTDLDPVIRKIQLNYKNLPETVQNKLNNPNRSEIATELLAQALKEKTINPKITVYTLEELIDEANKLESNTKKAETIREFGGLIKYLNNPNIQIARLKDATIEEFVNSLERLKFNIDHPIQIPNSNFFMGFDNVVDLNELKQLLGFQSRSDLNITIDSIASQLKDIFRIKKGRFVEKRSLFDIPDHIKEMKEYSLVQMTGTDNYSSVFRLLDEKGLLEKLIYVSVMQHYGWNGDDCSKTKFDTSLKNTIDPVLGGNLYEELQERGVDLNLLYETAREGIDTPQDELINQLEEAIDIDSRYSLNSDFSDEEMRIYQQLNREIVELNLEIEMAIEDLGKIQSEEKFENAFSKKNTELRGKFNTLIEKYTHTLRELRSKENAKVITLTSTPNHKIIYDRYRDYTFDRANYAGLTTKEKLVAQQLDYEVMARLDMITRQQIPDKFSAAYSQIRRYSTAVSNASSSSSLWFNFDKLPKLDKKVIIDCIKTARAIIFDNLSTEEKIERQSEFQDEIKEEVNLLYWADKNKNLNNFLPTLLDVFYCRIISKNDKEYNKQKFIPVDRTEEVTKFRATIENRVRENGKMVDFAINFMHEKYNQLAQFNPPTDGQHKLLIAVDNFLKKVDTNRIHDRYDIDNLENYTNIDFSEFNEHIYDNEFINNAKKLFIEIKNLLGIDLENTYKTKTNLNKLLELKSSLDSSLEHTKLILKLQINFEGVDISQIQKELSRLLIQIDIIAKAPNTETIVDDTDKLISEINNCLLDFNKIVKNKSLKISFDNTLEQLIIEKKSIMEQLKEAHPDKHLNSSEEGQDNLLERTKQLIDELSKIKDRINEFKKLESLLD
jgi:Avirulence protein